jgi:predicted 3-demethylubiquinone-9 3-methyltransferase (glyoxalase superfamily)
MENSKQKLAPFLWFDNNCEEAINFYIGVFNKNPNKKIESRIVSINYYPDNVDNEHMKGMDGKVLTGIFELEDQRFMALDGGPIFKFNESVSFYIEVDGQEEVDYFWDSLSAVPQSEQCGWIKDKYGLSWQIIPKEMGELISKDKSGRVITAMLGMKKIVIADLESAYEEK